MLDYFDIDWPSILKFGEKNVDTAKNNFFDAINFVPNKYAPLKRVNKYKLRLKKNLEWLLLFKNQSILKSQLQIYDFLVFSGSLW